MSAPVSPYEIQPPSSRRLAATVGIAVAAAAAVLVAIVLPAEYGIDPTGFGRLTGLANLHAGSKPFEIEDVIGGNETYREVEVPDFGEPVPLPNPAVHQDHEAQAPAMRTVQVTLPPEGETEIKTALDTGKVILYSWKVDRGRIYSDFHGHDPEAGDEYWVRYKEQQEADGNNGSLVAPFSGEHGWYWLNYNEFPVTVTLTVSGYFKDIIDYGVH
ncbi:MAG TPA: hypothetical protein VFV10_18805 [Gammaproteobacteria bacterium]|nr:hypothetical protein [Gammaproteobacteria bacterium]